MAAVSEEMPWDLYREIHKALRLALFDVTALAGTGSTGDAPRTAHLVELWREVAFLLKGHHGHEDEFVDLLVQRHAPDLRDDLEREHDIADDLIASLSASADALANGGGSLPAATLQRFYLDLSGFTSLYLRHLDVEERVVMPRLNAAMSSAELADVTNAIRGSVPPPEMCVFVRYMVRGMNYPERVDMLGGMFAGAPPDIFEMFRAAAQSALTADEYAAVATAAGFAG
ncbi:MAG: hemerythrin domain-containing protein [Acidimicrobiia bacterium]